MNLALYSIYLLLIAVCFPSIESYLNCLPKDLRNLKFIRLAKKESSPEAKKSVDNAKMIPKIGFGEMIQLITMGAGAPSLGEYKRTDENGKMFFELDANNFADAEGNSLQTKQKYFIDGYVEDENSDKPPGFWSNLLSGGKLQSEWEKKIKK